jgi:hypothetical protein
LSRKLLKDLLELGGKSGHDKSMAKDAIAKETRDIAPGLVIMEPAEDLTE